MKGAAWSGGGLLAVLLTLPLILLGAVSAPPQAQAGALNTSMVPAEYVALVQQAGAMCEGESAPLIAAQIHAESGWNPTAVSPAGAQGIAQFMPGTWAMWGKDYSGDGVANPFDLADAIPSQGAFMCALFSEVDAAKKSGRITRGTAKENALAAYNAGMGNVLRSGGFPTGIGETDAYVPRILALEIEYTMTGGTGGAWAHPMGTARYTNTSPFGMRFHPIHHEWRLHNGQDMAAPIGTPLMAACTGTVTITGYLGSGGLTTEIDCGGGVQVRYLHQNSIGVRVGQAVPAGSAIGELGNTGGSTGPHLHFVTEVGGTPVDPVPFMAAKGINL